MLYCAMIYLTLLPHGAMSVDETRNYRLKKIIKFDKLKIISLLTIEYAGPYFIVKNIIQVNVHTHSNATTSEANITY